MNSKGEHRTWCCLVIPPMHVAHHHLPGCYQGLWFAIALGYRPLISYLTQYLVAWRNWYYFQDRSSKGHQKAASWSGNYQDSTTAPLSRTRNDNAAAQEDVDPQDILVSSCRANILPTVVRSFEKSYVSSGLPHSANKPNSNNSMIPLWIEWGGTKTWTGFEAYLDVKTRWSSTHQMMCMYFSLYICIQWVIMSFFQDDGPWIFKKKCQRQRNPCCRWHTPSLRLYLGRSPSFRPSPT